MKNIISPKAYFKNLPEWDGTDYLTPFINRLQTTNQELWTETFTMYLSPTIQTRQELRKFPLHSPSPHSQWRYSHSPRRNG